MKREPDPNQAPSPPSRTVASTLAPDAPVPPVITEPLAAVQAILEAASGHLELDAFLRALLDRVRALVHADTATILLVEEGAGVLAVRASSGLEREVRESVRVPIGQGFAGMIAATARALVVPVVAEFPVVSSVLREYIVSLAGVPLIVAGRVTGILHVGTRNPHVFGEQELTLLRLVAERSALAIERTRLFSAQQESERRFRAAFDQAAVAMVQLSLDGRFLHVNERCTALWGYTAAELTAGMRFADVTAPEESADDVRQLQRLVSGELQRFQREKRYIRKDGRVVWGNVSASVVRDDGERPLYIITVIDDITERKHAEDDLRRALAVRDQFLTIASHELKTPLTTLLLQAQALLRDTSRATHGAPISMEKLGERAARIRANVGRMTDLVHQLLDVSRINEGRLSLSLDDVMPAELAREVVARFEEEAARARCDIRCVLDETLGPARWDRLKIDQVLTNLLSNAIKYGAGASIEVRLEPLEGGARFVVRDHGIGLPPGTEGRVFERFERFVSERHYGGFGVGLWIARELVRAHHGDIRVVRTDGPGAKFVVELPLGPVPESVPEP